MSEAWMNQTFYLRMKLFQEISKKKEKKTGPSMFSLLFSPWFASQTILEIVLNHCCRVEVACWGS